MSHVSPVKVDKTVTVTTPTVACDGGPRFGHPTIYLNVAQRGFAYCPYCSTRYELDANAKPDHGH